jgi:signal transduction histidine kinase/CheY-like chemotaxis protein
MATFSPASLRRGIAPSTWRAAGVMLTGLCAVALAIAVVWMVARSNAARDDALALEQHSYDVMVLTRSLDASLARSEAALGRYVVNGDKRTGTTFYDEWRRAEGQMRQLHRLTVDAPDQAALVEHLDRVYRRRQKELADAAGFANVGKGWYAIGMFNRAGQSPTVRDIADTLDKIAENEHARLDTLSQATIFSAERSNNFATLLSALGLSVVALALTLGWLAALAASQRERANELAEAEGDRATLLEEAVADRTRELRDANEQLRTEAEIRIRTEAQLAQSQKMEAVGQLTGGIAHDFNNMLAVVVSGLDMARRKFDQHSPDTGGYIDSAMEGADRASALTRRLLSFARAEPLLPDQVSPGALVLGMTDLLDRTLGDRIAVHTQVAHRIWPIWADRHQLENAILNLAVNARDAMDGVGRLDLCVENISIAAGNDRYGAVAPGDYVRIGVTDDGSGMTEEVKARAFEPFFTTKPAGKGTGLGLSQIFGLVRQSQGDVTIDSAPGQGTTISLFLPRQRGSAAIDHRERAAMEPIETPARHDLSILLVEDDPRVHNATFAALKELGHRPTGCASGAEALELLATRHDFDLLLTDVMMPGITGPELVERIHRDHPHIAILFATGYVGEAGQSDQFTGFEVLRKPFTINALGKAIAKAIGRQPTPSKSRAA